MCMHAYISRNVLYINVEYTHACWAHVYVQLCMHVVKRWPHSPSFHSPLSALCTVLASSNTHTHTLLNTHTHTHFLCSNPSRETETDPAAWHKSYWFYYLLQWMIFLSQFLNLEMSSILITTVEGFFKMLELRRGGGDGRRRRRRRGARKKKKWKEVKICVCLALEKEGIWFLAMGEIK